VKVIKLKKYYLLISFILFFIFGCNSDTDNTIKDYNVIVKKLYYFQNTYSRLPNDEEFYKIIKELGYKGDESCPCYNKVSENEYDLWFGLSLGESMVYNSKSKKWSKQG